MADETKATTAEEADSPKKKSKLIPVVVMLVTGVVGYFAGTTVLAPRLLVGRSADADMPAVTQEDGGEAGHGAPAETTESGGDHGTGGPSEGDAHFVEVGNILVNPRDSRGLRFLMATIALETEDARTRSMLLQREAQVRDVVISVLEQLTMDQLTMPGSRDSIRADIRTQVMQTFGLPFLRVFISQYVLN